MLYTGIGFSRFLIKIEKNLQNLEGVQQFRLHVNANQFLYTQYPFRYSVSKAITVLHLSNRRNKRQSDNLQ